MFCYLIILYRKHCVYYKIWYNCTNLIQQSLQLFFVIFNLFGVSLIQMKPVCDAFLDFQICSPRIFLKLWLSPLLNMQKQKKSMKEQSEGAKKKQKKIIFNSKKEFVRNHSFMTSLKKSKFRTPTHLFPSIHNHSILKFWSKQIPLLDVLHSHSKPAPRTLGNFEQLFNCKRKYSIYYSHMYYKTDRKGNIFSPIRLFLKGYCTFGVFIAELQVKYKRSFRMETV